MKPSLNSITVGLILLTAGAAWAGGSNYGITPGARPNLVGKISEWAVPTPQFARDPAPGPDGNIYIAVMSGNKIARFDTRAETFTEWELPAGARPHGLLVDKNGQVWYTGNGNGTIGQLDPTTGKVTERSTARARCFAWTPSPRRWLWSTRCWQAHTGVPTP